MIAYFVDGPRPRRTMGLHKGPMPYVFTYDVLDMGKKVLGFMRSPNKGLPEPSIHQTRYRRFTIIGDRAYYSVEPEDDEAWQHLSDLICQDIDQDRRAAKAGLR